MRRGNRSWVGGIGAAVLGALAVVSLGADEPTLESLPRTKPLEPAEAAGTIRALHGFSMRLLASEPLVTDPVAAAYDEDGRLYVAEMNDYPYVDPDHDKPFQENTEDPPAGRIRLLVDRDDDGRFDEGQVFAEAVSWPAGIAVWKGGIFVAAAPDILYLKDTDGDGKADVRRKVFTGFRKYNVQALLNNLKWGLDHALYAAASGNGGKVRPGDEPESDPVVVARRDFRFEPATGRFGSISGGARFGNTFDDWGNRFLCDIRNPAEHVVLPARYLARNPNLPAPRAMHDAALSGDNLPVFRISPPEPWRELRARRWTANGKPLPHSELVGSGVVTSSSGVTIYRGDAYPKAYRGNLFLGEVAGNLVHRQTVSPDGVTFVARRADENVEFAASTDTWFRPVNYVHAPDGTLHVLDMYRETIEHPWSIPDDIRARLDLRSGSDRGRIYRLEPPGFSRRATPKLSRATTEELVELLSHPNAWHWETAHRLIFERQDRSAVGPLRRLLREGESPLGRLHALWSLDGLEALADDDLMTALGDSSAGVREHAVRLAEDRLKDSQALKARVVGLAADPEIRVRFQVAFSLGALPGGETVGPLAAIARRDAEDEWVRTAVLTSAGENGAALFETLAKDSGFVEKPGGQALLLTLAGVLGSRGQKDEAVRVLAALSDGPMGRSKQEDELLTLALAMGEGLRHSGAGLFDLPADSENGQRAKALLERLSEYAAGVVGDESAPVPSRVSAANLFGFRPYAEARDALAPLLAPEQPSAVQVASAKALAMQKAPEVAGILLEAWPGATPALRDEILRALIGRSNGIPALLDAIEAGSVQASLIPSAQRSLLTARSRGDQKERATRLLAVEPLGPRKEVIDRYRSSLRASADPQEGRKVFARECMTCHKLGDEGHSVGPNLASIRGRTAEEVLEHVLDPNREVAPDFIEYVAALKDGRVATGVIESESANSLTLKRAEGVTETILRRDVEAIRSTGKSLMPEGLEERVRPEEMSDLIAFLLELQK